MKRTFTLKALRSEEETALGRRARGTHALSTLLTQTRDSELERSHPAQHTAAPSSLRGVGKEMAQLSMQRTALDRTGKFWATGSFSLRPVFPHVLHSPKNT